MDIDDSDEDSQQSDEDFLLIDNEALDKHPAFPIIDYQNWKEIKTAKALELTWALYKRFRIARRQDLQLAVI